MGTIWSPSWGLLVCALLVCCSLGPANGQSSSTRASVFWPTVNQQIQHAQSRLITTSTVLGFTNVFNNRYVSNLIDGQASTGWQPYIPPNGQVPVEFHFDLLGQQAYLITGFTIIVNPTYSSTNNAPILIGLVNGTEHSLLDAVETYAVGTAVQYGNVSWSSNSSGNPLGTQYFQVTNPFVANMLTVVYYAPPTTEILVYETTFYGVPILQASGVHDITGVPGTVTCGSAQVIVDGAGTSTYCPPEPYANQRYNFQIQLNLNTTASYTVTGFIFKAPTGAHYPATATWWGANRPPSNLGTPIAVNISSTPGSNGYQLATLPSSVVVQGGSWITVGFGAYYAPFMQQVQIVGTALPGLSEPGIQSVMPYTNCPLPSQRNIATQQFYQRYNAPFVVAANTLPLNATVWQEMKTWWNSTAIALWHVPSCFPFPMLPVYSTDVINSFNQNGLGPGGPNFWRDADGLTDAYNGCSTQDPSVAAMCNELLAMEQDYNLLQPILTNYLNTYYSDLLGPSSGYQFSITQVGAAFTSAWTGWEISEFNFLQGEINQLAAASSSSLALALGLLSIFGAAVPGVGAVFGASATIGELAGAALAISGGLLSTAATTSSTATPATIGVALSSPFDSLLNSGWAVQPTFSPAVDGCTGQGCVTLALDQLSSTMGVFRLNITAASSALTNAMLSNYGYFRIFNAWFQAYNQPVPNTSIYPQDIPTTLATSALSAQAMFRAVVAWKMLTTIFQVSWYNTTIVVGPGPAPQPNADPSVTVLVLPSGSSYPGWESPLWNATRSIFAEWNPNFFLAQPPLVYSKCPSMKSICRDNSYLAYPTDYQPFSDCGCIYGGNDVPYYKGVTNATISSMFNSVIPPPFVAGADPQFFTAAMRPGASNSPAVPGTPAGVIMAYPPNVPPPSHIPGGPGR